MPESDITPHSTLCANNKTYIISGHVGPNLILVGMN